MLGNAGRKQEREKGLYYIHVQFYRHELFYTSPCVQFEKYSIYSFKQYLKNKQPIIFYFKIYRCVKSIIVHEYFIFKSKMETQYLVLWSVNI